MSESAFVSDVSKEIILHNYPQSPVAEKVRVALGIKGLSWRSVIIPRIPPKPMLTALTGGYRRTPVMQIGADIYCDSQNIIRALDRLFPSPAFFPTADTGLMWTLSRWTDGAFFDLAVKLVLGAGKDELPSDFAQDRGRLYFGENWAERLSQANAELPHIVAQVRVLLSWLNDQLSDGRRFLLGDSPAALDAQMYCIVWFMRGRWDGAPMMLSEFPALERWEGNIQNVGHGTSSEMSPEDAIARAKACNPVAPSGVDPHDPQALKVGMAVTVTPDVDGGEQPVEGTVRFADVTTLVIDRSGSDVGDVSVHFPRAGYRIQVN